MRLLRLIALLLPALLAGCIRSPCCSDGDCAGNAICSEQCAQNGGREGECLIRCQVDADCGAGLVCDAFGAGCACAPGPRDGGAGSCPRGSG